jgi:chromosome segregation ATPase
VALKIFSLVKANAEIERLQAELATANARNATLEQSNKELDTAWAEAGTQVETVTAENALLKTQVAERDVRIKALAAAAAKSEADLQAELNGREVAITNRASQRALEIVASQGLPQPLATPTTKQKIDKSKLKGKYRMAAAIREEMHLPE